MKNNRIKLVLFPLLLLTIFLIIIITPTVAGRNIKTVKPEKIIYEDKITTNGLILRDEIVLTNELEISEIDKFVNEGERVPKGYLIGRITDSNNGKQEIYSSSSGFISFTIDGYENIDVSSIKNANDYFFSNLFNYTDKSELPGIKIINSYIWHIVINVDSDIYDKYNENDKILIEIEDDINKVFKSKLVEKVKTPSYNLFLLENDKFIHEILNLRNIKINIITMQDEVYKIPKTSLTFKDGKQGVFVNEYYGVVGFRAVKLIDVAEDFAYVSCGNENGNIIIDEDTFKTIDIYSEIIINPESVEYGQITR